MADDAHESELEPSDHEGSGNNDHDRNSNSDDFPDTNSESEKGKDEDSKKSPKLTKLTREAKGLFRLFTNSHAKWITLDKAKLQSGDAMTYQRGFQRSMTELENIIKK